MPQGDTFHGFLFWVLFWLLLGPFVVMIYIPIGVWTLFMLRHSNPTSSPQALLT